MQLTKRNIKQAFLVLLWILLVPVITYLASTDVKAGMGLSIVFVGGAIALVCIVNYRLGYYLYIGITFILPMLERMSGTELSKGVAMDGLLLATLLGCIFKRGDKSIGKVKFASDPILICMYLYLLMLLAEIFNPSSYSVLGWYVFMRVALRAYILLYIGLNVFNSMKDVHTFFKFWLALGTAAAFYCCIQKWFGLLPYEQSFMARYPEKFGTTMILSGIRLFSFMSDAAVLGIILACNIIIMLVLLTASMRTINLPRKVALLVSVLLHVLALGYTGTRTGYVMLPLGLMIFFLANLHKRNTILAAMAFCFFSLAILYGPFYGNPTIVRVRTAFIGKQDESVNVRDRNRHRIQPYMHTHPFGGGVNTTGGNGETYQPGHPLAGFQSDNGYLRQVLEIGWLGLILVAGIFFFLVQTAVINFFKATTELDKLLMIGLASASFAAAVSQYAQDTFTLVETAIMLFAFIGVAIKVRYINV
ncbi:O-antigen ligase family protein [Chitinophaga japonensis]|uniref:O-antigen ligase-like membrane protein n=1 Tax=Chitinophaga japonensis TaxID=104662 RepID=A0A562SZC8_CHIJA|nr:O-antigen ligase family protein [Chitinophaga japonensis]TWI86196.1 O-antigen ligase-like membrane protein [Chitinophaga japonensis]